MEKEKIEQDIIDIINKQVFVPKMVAGLESFIADYIEDILEKEAEESYDRYYEINQD